MYEYMITITTGIWRNAGTTASIAMQIYGSEENTSILYLSSREDSDSTLFCRGSSDVFVIAVQKPLGFLHGVRIGHNNTGISPSWFLEDIVIQDVQTSHSWSFSNNQWLALERGDGKIERMLKYSTDKSEFTTEVFKRWWKGLAEKHIWMSVFAKLPRVKFSRRQRSTCCLSMLLSGMLANAMFYRLDEKYTQEIQVGVLKFSWRTVVIGIESALIVAPINIFIACLFHKGNSRKPYQQTCTITASKWQIHVAWFLCFCTCAVSTTLTIFYSLIWHKSVSEQWLSSMVISIVQDILVKEPVKVFLGAVFLAAIKRRKKGQVDVLSTPVESCQMPTRERLWKLESFNVERMRKRQATKHNFSQIFVELFVYCSFALLVMVLCYGNRNNHRYLMTKSMRDGLPGLNKVNDSLTVYLEINIDRLFLFLFRIIQI